MDDAEDCPIGSDTGRQREHGGEAESGGLSKQPEVLVLTVFSFISRLPLPFLVSAWKAALMRETVWSVMFPFPVRAWALPLVEIWNLRFTEQVLCVHFACFFVAGGGGDSGDGSG